LDLVNELAEIRIVRLPAGRRSKSGGGNIIRTISPRVGSWIGGKKINFLKRLPSPLSQLPWDIAQDEFGGKGTDFIGALSKVLFRTAQS